MNIVPVSFLVVLCFFLIMFLCYSPYRQNDYGQIGSGSTESVVVPRFVEGVGRVSKVTCGSNHNLALTGTVMHCAGPLRSHFNQHAISKQ